MEAHGSSQVFKVPIYIVLMGHGHKELLLLRSIEVQVLLALRYPKFGTREYLEVSSMLLSFHDNISSLALFSFV